MCVGFLEFPNPPDVFVPVPSGFKANQISLLPSPVASESEVSPLY